MSQTLHILRKDIRHHWPEILLSLALMVAFAVEQPRSWTHQALDSRFLYTLTNYLPVLMILSWIFLIIRLVQGESLVGDRLFWITRPYEWHKLLAAKLLAVILFIHLPLFVSQLILLKIASFPVVSSIPGLLYVHSLFVLALWLPGFTIGSITSGIGQAALLILALVLGLLGLVYIISIRPDMDFATDVTDNWQESVYVLAALTAIFLQYVYRRTIFSRLIVAAGLASICLIILLAPYESLINRDFPLPTQNHPRPAQFSLNRSLSFEHAPGKQTNSYGDEVDLEIPLQLSGLAEKTILDIRGVKLDIDLPAGEHWTSGWHKLYHRITYGRTLDWPSISMKKSVFNRIKDVPVRASITLGMNLYSAGSATEILFTGDRLSIASGARCLNDLSQNSLHCFSALKQPEPLLVMAILPNSSCAVSQESVGEGLAQTPASYSALGSDGSPDFEFSPVREFGIDLTRYFVFEDRQIRLPVCPGTSLFVSKPEFRYSVRDEIDLGDITLLNYLPTYPRRIVPPRQPRSPGAPSNSLSLNALPDPLHPGPT